jgi:glucokinase
MRDANSTLPFPVLIGDIGGTNARFAIVPDRDAPLESFQPVATKAFADIESAVEESVFAHTKLHPRSALIDVAGPIVGDAVDLTNADWIVRPRDMIDRLGVEDVVLLNDFEALALALTALGPDDLVKIGGGEPSPTGAKVVIGPGTGLGVGALVHAGGAEGPWVPVPGEGGHVALGPAAADEFAIWPNVEPEDGRISAEVLLAGRGIVALYRAVAKTTGEKPRYADPAEVTRAALDGSDAVAVRTLGLYARLLGRLAGDMALVFMAHGGAYIGGGIPPRILRFLTEGEFRRAFETKYPHEAVMATIPVYVIIGKNPALKGLAAYARTPHRFGVNLLGRRWLR